jgi:hypothetical protein
MLQIVIVLIFLNIFTFGMYVTNHFSDQKQHDLQEPILQRATDAVGMPNLQNFQERLMLRKILEARDQAINTTVYMVGPGGHLAKVCDAVGYGIPSATQFTNPAQYWQSSLSLPQAEPNALFSPPTGEGIWVNCLDPASKTLQIVFIQPRVIISPFSLAGS